MHQTYIPENNFWDLSFNDIATGLIALINILLVGYIFIYQRKKDFKDHRFLLSQINFNIKSEWFKTVILDPNIPVLNIFFNKTLKLFSGKSFKLDNDKKTELIQRLNKNCNKLEYRFISSLGCIDQNLENQCIEIVDNLRDNLSLIIDKCDEINTEEVRYSLSQSKKEFILKIYNFKPAELN